MGSAIDALGVGQPTVKKQRSQQQIYDDQAKLAAQTQAKAKQDVLDKRKQEANKPVNKAKSFLGTLVKGGQTAVSAVAKPVADVATGQGGKAAHDTAQLTADVTGGGPNQLARGLRYVPQAVVREVQNKPVGDIQEKAFGTAKSGDIAKKILGSTAGTASLFVGGGEAKAALGAKAGAKQLAKETATLAGAGAVGGAGTQISNKPDSTKKEIIKSAELGAATGAVIPSAGRIIGKTGQSVKATGEKIKTAKMPELERLAKEETEKQNKNAIADMPNPDEIPDPTPKPEIIPPSKEQILAQQKVTAEGAKVAEKDTAELKKVDQQLELLDAKKKDSDVVSEVDKVKTKQLQERKQELETKNNMSQDVQAPTGSKIASETTSPPPAKTTHPSGVRAKNSAPIAEQGSLSEQKNLTDTEVLAGEPTGKGTTPPDVNDGKFTSRVYKRMQDEHPELKDDVGYEGIRLKEDTEKAVDLLSKDKQKAFQVAMGQESSPDVTSTSTNIAMFEKAMEEKNYPLASRLVKNRSLAQTRRGQELVAEKSSITDNSTARYVKELIATKMEKAGKKYLTGVELKDKTPTGQKITKRVDQEVSKLESKIKTKKLDARSALGLLEKLECL